MNKTILICAMALMMGSFSGLPLAAENPAPAAAASPPAEQDSLSLMRAHLRMDKHEFVKAAMNLSDKDSEKFWSLYHQYEADLMKLNDKKLKLIQDYAADFNTMTEDKAGKLAKTAFELQKDRTSLLESYYKKVAKATSNRVAVRFAQVENVVNSAFDVNLGTSIPLMPKQ